MLSPAAMTRIAETTAVRFSSQSWQKVPRDDLKHVAFEAILSAKKYDTAKSGDGGEEAYYQRAAFFAVKRAYYKQGSALSGGESSLRANQMNRDSVVLPWAWGNLHNASAEGSATGEDYVASTELSAIVHAALDALREKNPERAEVAIPVLMGHESAREAATRHGLPCERVYLYLAYAKRVLRGNTTLRRVAADTQTM